MVSWKENSDSDNFLQAESKFYLTFKAGKTAKNAAKKWRNLKQTSYSVGKKEET